MMACRLAYRFVLALIVVVVSSRALAADTVNAEEIEVEVTNEHNSNNNNNNNNNNNKRVLQEPTTTTTKVVIVGGGASGLFAAYTLDAAGIDFILLEAKPEIGGRTRELSDFVDVPFDLGAEWLHYPPDILQELLIYPEDKASVAETIQTIEYKPETMEIYSFGRLWTRNGFARIATQFYDDWKFYNTTWFSYLYTNVYSYVSDRVLKDTPVRTIDYSNSDKIVVTSVDNRVFEAERVIVATPVTILQDSSTLQFVPDLPRSHRRIIDRILMPAGLKVWIEFDERFYSDLVVVENLALNVWRFIDNRVRGSKAYLDAVFKKPTNRNVLLLFETGNTEVLLRRVAMEDDELIADVLAELDEIYDGKASQHYMQHYIQNWSADPYIRGCYALNLFNFRLLRRPIENRIFLAGSYLGGENQSQVYGASKSGKRAGQLVAESLS